MKYKPGDVIPLTDKINRIVMGSWQVKDWAKDPITGDIIINRDAMETINWYFCVTFSNREQYNCEDISKFVKGFGKWMREDEVQKIQ